MKLETLQYQVGKGWSQKNFPDLDSEQTLILVFAAPEFIENPEPIQEIRKHYPRSKIMGCSSAGEIAGTSVFDHSLSVAIARFEHTTLKLAKVEHHIADKSYTGGEQIAKELNTRGLRSIFILSNGLEVNGTELVKGINNVVDDSVVVTGGLAGDGKDFKKTWTIYNGEMCKNQVVAIGLYGTSLQIGHASRGGWDIFGPERRITRSKDNILYELDGRPALELYKEYLGEKAKGLPATGLLFPLAIRENASDTRQLVRTILSVNEAEQSLTFAGDVPAGYFAQLMRANFDRLITSAGTAGEVAFGIISDKVNTGPLLAIAISCVGRRLLLGERIDEEIESTLETLPQGTKQIGFYSYGELSPYSTGKCDLHNQTMTLTLFSEA